MYRRDFIKNFTYLSSSLCLNHLINKNVFANEALKVLTLNIAKVTKTWDEMSVEADVPISFYEKKGSAPELIEIFSKGDGIELYDAVTDNGGNQEDKAFGVVESYDNGFNIIGRSYSFGSERVNWMVKTDSFGMVQ